MKFSNVMFLRYFILTYCLQVVANIPFNISTDIVKLLLPMGDIFSEVVLLLQVCVAIPNIVSLQFNFFTFNASEPLTSHGFVLVDLFSVNFDRYVYIYIYLTLMIIIMGVIN